MSGTEEALRRVSLAQPIEEELLKEDVWLSLTADQRRGIALVAADTVRRVLTNDANVNKIADAMRDLQAAISQLQDTEEVVHTVAMQVVRTIASVVQPTAVRLHCDWSEDEPNQITAWAWELPDGEMIEIWEDPNDDHYELEQAVANLRSWEQTEPSVHNPPHPYVNLKPEEAP